MQNDTTKATKTITVAVANTAPPVKAPSPKALALTAHDTAGFTGLSYGGLSKPRNGGIHKAPAVATSKATARTYAQLTPRMYATLSELRKAYGTKPFATIGIDRGQLAIFINSGFIAVSGDNGTLTAAYHKASAPVTVAAPAKA
jgi:hypothetical protein